MMSLKRNQKGFTLIEALIVVIIVAILAVLGIARFLGVREATADATCRSHLSTLNAAIKKYDLEHPTAPFTNTSTQWDAVWADAGNPKCPTGFTAGTDGGYSAVAAGVEFRSKCEHEVLNPTLKHSLGT